MLHCALSESSEARAFSLLPLVLSDAFIDEVKADLVELPDAKKAHNKTTATTFLFNVPIFTPLYNLID